jgi:rubredoxin
MDNAPRVKPVCQNCGSEHIERQQYASWSIESQTWEVFDENLLCFACETGPIEFVPLTLKDLAQAAIKQNEVV